MTDLELINRIIKGDRFRFNQLIRQWEKQIYNFIYRYLGNKELAFDVTQKTFIRTYKNINKLRDATKFSSWIYQIASNLCKDEIKKMHKQNLVSLDLIQENSEQKGYQLPDQFKESDHQLPDAKLNKKQIGEIVQKALQKLPEEQRVVVIMKEYQELKFTEIADILDEPINTVKSRLYYGLRAMKKVLETSRLSKEVLLNEM